MSFLLFLKFMPKKFKIFKPKEIIKILLLNNFKLRRTKGSHQIFVNNDNSKRVTVPMHNGKDLFPATLVSIIRQSGLSEKLFK